MDGAEAVIESLNGTADGRIKVFLTPFTIVPSVEPSNASTPDFAVTLTKDDRMQARRIRETARKWGVRIHSDAFAGQIRMAWQDKENGLLGPDVHLQHCWGISYEEIDILAETGTHVTHAPPGRSTPIMQMMARGVPVAITSDGAAPSRHFDMLQIARIAQSTQHILHNHDRYILPPGKVFEMITIDAARAIGMDHEIGSLEKAKGRYRHYRYAQASSDTQLDAGSPSDPSGAGKRRGYRDRGRKNPHGGWQGAHRQYA